MRVLGYTLIALALFTLLTWVSVYARDNSAFVARGSMPFDHSRIYELTLWLIEGGVEMTVFVPECLSVDLMVYSKGGGWVVYRTSLEGPLRTTLTLETPHPGYYTFNIKPRVPEGCQPPRVNGALNIQQYAQPETKVRTVLAVVTALTLVAGLVILAREMLVQVKPPAKP